MPSRTRVYDNGGKTADRYTLVIPSYEFDMLDMYGFNEQPYHPQGFGQYGGTYYKTKSYSHLGKLVSFASLSEQAQRFVRETLAEYTLTPDSVAKPTGKSKTKSKSTKRKGTVTTLREFRPGMKEPTTLHEFRPYRP